MTDSLHATPNAPEAPNPKPRARTHFKRILVTGLVILVPVTLTVYILKQIFDFMDGIFAPVIDKAIGVYLPGFHIPGLGLLLTLLVVLLLGWLSTNVVGRRMIHGLEALICRIPVAKSIYSATKGVLEALRSFLRPLQGRTLPGFNREICQGLYCPQGPMLAADLAGLWA